MDGTVIRHRPMTNSAMQRRIATNLLERGDGRIDAA
jgi:hypothetical protein